jgi:hypothetical protein
MKQLKHITAGQPTAASQYNDLVEAIQELQNIVFLDKYRKALEDIIGAYYSKSLPDWITASKMLKIANEALK